MASEYDYNDSEDFTSNPHSSWHINKEYVYTHLLNSFMECNRLIKICKFGYEDIMEEMSTDNPNQLTRNRISALHRLMEEIKQIHDNTYFQLYGNHKKAMDKIFKVVGQVEKVIDGICDDKEDQESGEQFIKINESHYDNCLRELRKCLMKMKASLIEMIFPQSEEEESMEDIKRRLINQG